MRVKRNGRLQENNVRAIILLVFLIKKDLIPNQIRHREIKQMLEPNTPVKNKLSQNLTESLIQRVAHQT